MIGGTLWIFDTCINDPGEPVEKMSMRGRELVATGEPMIVTKLLFDAIIVEDDHVTPRE